MGQPFIGEIRLVGFNFAPVGWAFCNGATLPISEFDALFNLIGTTYGGDGQQTFNLPDLQGRVPIHQGTDRSGNNYIIGQRAGSETVTVTTQQIPSHTHALSANTTLGTSTAPGGNVLAVTAANTYIMPTTVVALNDVSTPTGGSQPHDNLMPFLCANFIIALFGIFPSQG